MAVTIFDIAKEAACSASTVSLVMKDSNKIKDSTKKRVLEVAERLGYAPSYAAQSLANGQTYTLGVIVPNLTNPLFSEMVSGIEKTASEFGYNIILGVSAQSDVKERQYVRMLSQRRIDGLILFPSFLNNDFPDLIQMQESKRIPIILCGNSLEHNSSIGYVKCDNHMGGYIATEHLIEIGKKRIAILSATANPHQSDSRISGYRDALEFYGIPYDENLVVSCSQSEDDIFNATVSLIKSKKIDGLFCLYDYMALTSLQAIASLDLKAPKDIAVVGYDNISITTRLTVPLTTIDIHAELMGSMTVKQLINNISNPDSEIRKVILKPELIKRESTGLITKTSD